MINSSLQTLQHINMSIAMSMEKFLKLQNDDALPTMIMIEPQVEWFPEDCNYPVNAIEWAKANVHCDAVIHSTIFHQSDYRKESIPDSGAVSVITITVSGRGDSKEVRLEMTVGHDKIMTVTRDKLTIRSKYGCQTFEVWHLISMFGAPTWKKIRSLVETEHSKEYHYPPAHMSLFGGRMVSLMCAHMPLCGLDLKNTRDKMMSEIELVKNSHSRLFSNSTKTPKKLEDLYTVTATAIRECNRKNLSNDEVLTVIKLEFDRFMFELWNYSKSEQTQ